MMATFQQNRRARRTGALLALALMVWAAPSPAQDGDDLFTVVAFPVDAEAKTATKARDLALAQGQAAAFRAVLRRLTLIVDEPRLPRPKLPEVVQMVRAIVVENEKTSATRYLAELTISFQKSAIRRLLRGGAIPFTETRARPVLVLPVLQVGESLRLFDEDNRWLEAWALHEMDRGAMLPLLPPIGDLEDITAIDAKRAVAGDRDALAAIGARHGTETQLVVTARQRGRPRGRSARAMDVTLSWHGALRDGVEVRPFVPENGESERRMMRRVVRLIVADLEGAWKRETLISFDEEFRLSAHVPISTLADWIAVRARLERNSMVQRFDLLAISKTGAQVELHYLGTRDRLRISLAQDGLELAREDTFWTLTADGGADARSRE